MCWEVNAYYDCGVHIHHGYSQCPWAKDNFITRCVLLLPNPNAPDANGAGKCPYCPPKLHLPKAASLATGGRGTSRLENLLPEDRTTCETDRGYERRQEDKKIEELRKRLDSALGQANADAKRKSDEANPRYNKNKDSSSQKKKR